jgi:hypothetical protein
VPLAFFEGFEKEALVRLDDPGLVFGLVSCRIILETMAPTKRGVLVAANSDRTLSIKLTVASPSPYPLGI